MKEKESNQESKVGLRWKVRLSIVISGMFFNGVIYGYTSPALPSFQQQEKHQKNIFDELFPNDITLTSDEASILTSVTQLGFPIGGLLSGVLASLLGKRYASLYGQALSYILGHCLLMSASSVNMLFGGRFLCGLCQGFCNCLTIVYILDLCENVKTKAVCGVLLSLVGNAGTLITYTIGIFVNWRQLAFILVLLAFPYVVGLIIFLPNDFPQASQVAHHSCLTKRKLERRSHQRRPPADKNCKTSSTEKFFQQQHPELNTKEKLLMEDIEDFQFYDYDDEETSSSSASASSTSSFSLYSNLTNLFRCKNLFLGIGMCFFYQFAGYNVVANYAGSILQAEEELLFNTTSMANNKNESSTTAEFLSHLDPALVSSTFVGLAGLFGVVIGVILVQRGFNRKWILLFSALGTAMAFAGLGLHRIFNYNANDVPWVQTLCLVMHVMIFNLGYGCLGYPMMAELLPSDFRTKGLAFIMVMAGLFGFANSLSFVQLELIMDKNSIFFTYASINVLGFFYLLMFLPNMEIS